MTLLIALKAPLLSECCLAARNGGLALAQMFSAAPSLRRAWLGLSRLAFMGLLLANSGCLGSSHKHWSSFGIHVSAAFLPRSSLRACERLCHDHDPARTPARRRRGEPQWSDQLQADTDESCYIYWSDLLSVAITELLESRL